MRKDENYIPHCILHMPGYNQSYGSCVLHVVSWCLTFVSSFMKICQAVLKLCKGHENCYHTKGNNSKSRNQSYGSCALHDVS